MSETKTLAEWTAYPFTSYDLRSTAVEHRIVVEAYDGVGVDVCHEVRSEYIDQQGWVVAEVVEARPHGLSTVTRLEGAWWA